MVAVTIDLRNGFDGDRVVIAVDGRSVFDKADVRTRYQVSLAERVTVDMAPGRRTVRLALPERDRNGEVVLDPQVTPYLSASVEATRVVLEPAAEAFHYR